MKFFLSLLLLASISALAEPMKANKTVLCDKAESVISALTDSDYREKPIWIGKSPNNNFGLLINDKTGTWTLIEFDNKIACVLGSGETYQILAK